MNQLLRWHIHKLFILVSGISFRCPTRLQASDDYAAITDLELIDTDVLVEDQSFERHNEIKKEVNNMCLEIIPHFKLSNIL